MPTADGEAKQAELYEPIGRLKMELEWVKTKAAAIGCVEAAAGRAGPRGAERAAAV